MKILLSDFIFFFQHFFQHYIGHVTTGSFIGRGNQYIQLVKVHKLSLGDAQFNLLGIHFSRDLTNLPSLNYQNGLGKAKKTINTWNLRHLTPIGKITVIKTLILSIFTHLFIAIPTPAEILDEINCCLTLCGMENQTKLAGTEFLAPS